MTDTRQTWRSAVSKESYLIETKIYAMNSLFNGKVIVFGRNLYNFRGTLPPLLPRETMAILTRHEKMTAILKKADYGKHEKGKN